MTIRKYSFTQMKFNAVYLLLLIFLLLSCEKKTEKKAAYTESEVNVKSFVLDPPVYLDTLATERQILAHFEQRKIELTKLLNQSSPEKANQLYTNYRLENDSALIL